MKTLTAKVAKYAFGRLIDLARAEPVLVAKHGRPLVVVMAVQGYERLKELDAADATGDKVLRSKKTEKFGNDRRRD